MEKEKKRKLLQFEDYISGWLDSSVHDFLDLLPHSPSTAFALVTSLDSNLEPVTVLQSSPELKKALVGAQNVDGALLFPSKVLRDPKIRSEVFVGFDEIWFFPTNDIGPKPKSTWIVGPGRIDQAKLDSLGDWMKANNCSLGMGDGDGLNVIVKARGMMKYLIALSMFQRKPALEISHVWVQDEENLNKMTPH
jgi:hypothetical protein